MRYKLSKDEFEQLSEELQGLYKANGDEYVLEVEGMPEAKPAPKTTKKERDQAQQLSELKQKYEALLQEQKDKEEKEAHENGDVDSIKKSYNQKIEDIKRELEEERQARSKDQRDYAVSQLIANSNVSEEFKPLVSRHFSDRLTFKDNEIVVTDADGNPTVNTLDDLVAETKSSFPSMFVGSAASGGGAIGGDSRATRKPLKEYSIEELDAMSPEERQEIIDAAESE